MSACSNITGILSENPEVSAILHRFARRLSLSLLSSLFSLLMDGLID